MMKLVRSGRFALFALAGLAAAASAPVQAADDKSTVSAVGELFGLSTDPSAASIDYHERPKLVLPPRLGELPPPREGARPEGWPSDTTTNRKRGSDRYARVPNAAAPAPEERKPGLLDRFMGHGSVTEANAPAAAAAEPSRRMLTEPPTGYRRATMDLNKIPDPEQKKSSWWNPWSILGASERADAQNVMTPSPQPGAGDKGQQTSSESSSWFRLPNFVHKNLEHD
jgi:hypothetical protein